LPLTTDAALISDFIQNLTITDVDDTGFTNTIDALRLAGDELNSENHNPNARRVMVMLTDGLPTDPDDARDILGETLALADELDRGGIAIYVIGLGAEVDRDFIRTMASGEENAYFAATGANLVEDLASIYTTITSDICETGPTKIDVIAKTKANFTPLR
jgi:Mg-chelatase subunit ChlD